MTQQLYWQCVIAYIIGMLMHILAVKIPSLRTRAVSANKKFHISEYFAEDWNIIIANTLFGALLILGADQLINWQPAVLEYIKWFFAFVGFTGSSIFLSAASAYGKKLLRIIDVKTNISDATVPITDDQAVKISKNTPDPQRQVAQAERISGTGN